MVDEAHKMSANYFGSKVNETKRFKLGKLLGSISRHFLLMTATPHNGKEEDFQLFMSLLDGDRFYGKFREGAHKVDISDMMRRMVKEDLLKFDGTPLFPERRAYTANYELSELESSLYADVTDYVKEEMNRADNLDGKRKGTVGFALTQLQRRLASSPEAIYQSLKRRRKKLENRLREEKLVNRGHRVAETLADYDVYKDVPDDVYEAAEEMPDSDYEQWVDKVVDQATAARTIEELQAEIIILEGLEEKARKVVHSGQDRKWEELSSLLQDRPEMYTSGGSRRKLILFTEHKDTLNYLHDRITGLLGKPDAVVVIHGAVNRDDRRKVQERFRNDPDVLVIGETRTPVFPKYERICFEKQHIRVDGKPMASLIHPGHPLMHAIIDLTLEAHRNKLKQGAVLADPNDDRLEPKVLFMLDHRIREGSGDASKDVSRRLQFVETNKKGQTVHAGWAPHLDLQPIDDYDLKLVADVLNAPWITDNLEALALAQAS